ncbi:MAG: glycoside hydrolase family 9 protein [Firmicutes bacterium]|nr:glycoside hydrolase family 9 protein [Bacillota bacterium]
MRKLSLGVLILTFLALQVFSASSLLAAANYNYVDAFAKSILYYEASWCGPDAGNNRLPWRGPCHVNDGADVGLDLTGGFHDAGDHVKFGLPQVYASSTLGWAYYEFKDTFIATGQDGYMLNILKHFTDYYLKCYPNNTTFHYQCGDGQTDHAYWGPPELQTTAVTTRPTLFTATTSTPASDVCGSAAASLALMYLNYQDRDATYANRCLTAAKNLYAFGKSTHKVGGSLSQSGGFYGSTTDLDDLSWGAIWLYLATNNASYLTDVDAYMTEKGVLTPDGGQGYSNHWTHCWDDVFAGVFVKLAQVSANTQYANIARENLTYFMTAAPTTRAGETFINSWGALRYTAAECMLALVMYKYEGTADYLNYAQKQIDYMLGTNPRNSSYVVGFGNNYPKFPHHRAASGRMELAPAYEHKSEPEKHLLYGALVGGPDANDQFEDDIEEYCYSEVAIDYNAGFVGAMAGMAKYFGQGQTPEATPGIEAGVLEYYDDACILKETTKECTIDVMLHCDTLLPPRYVKGLTFRYFVDLSEFYNAGLTASAVQAAADYAPNGGVISGLIPWDVANHIYYVEASWPNTENYGKIEFQFRIAAYDYDIFDASNDYSRIGLTSTRVQVDRIPVYLNGVKVYGVEPGGSNPTPTGRIATPTPTRRVTPTPTTRINTPTPTRRIATPTPTRRGATPTPTRRIATPTPTRRIATPTPTRVINNTPTPTPARGGNYAVSYVIASDWGAGATINVTITNNTATMVNGWTLAWTFPGNQTITNLWSGTFTQTGASVSVKNVDFNITIPANGGSVSFGFNLNYSGANAKPASFTLNGVACQVL